MQVSLCSALGSGTPWSLRPAATAATVPQCASERRAWAGACRHWLRSLPCLPIKARVFLGVLFMMCVNAYFVASAECLLWGKGWE